MASASTPPEPTSSTGPHSWSLRAPTISSRPFVTHAFHQHSIQQQSGPQARDVVLQHRPRAGNRFFRFHSEQNAARIGFVRQSGSLRLQRHRKSHLARKTYGFFAVDLASRPGGIAIP